MAIVTHTFLDKTNTIMEQDKINLGLNPILELYYGRPCSRGLIHFDIENIRKKVEDKAYPDIDKLHHKLKMKNVAGLKTPYQHIFNKYNDAERAKSFDLIFFKLDRIWDMGGGFDYLKDGYNARNIIYSTQGSNWLNATNDTKWESNGVFSRDKILSEYNDNNTDFIVAKQHFDVGNEDIDVDITNMVNYYLNNEETFYGLGIAFLGDIEETQLDYIRYVGFFTDHTHTFFHPYVETTYDEYIKDDRHNFFLDKPNRLYFYANVGGKMVNLDELPECVINCSTNTVKQSTKGVYYTELTMASSDYETETMHYDTWTNIKYNGSDIPDVELYFTTKQSNDYFTFGLPYETKKQEKIVPSISGINHKEQIEVGDIRKINVDCRIAYTVKQEYGVDGLEYKLYTKAGDTEINVIDWTPVERAYNENFFYINTNELVPAKYYIAIKVKKDFEEIVYKELCEFDILNNKKDLKC